MKLIFEPNDGDYDSKCGDFTIANTGGHRPEDKERWTLYQWDGGCFQPKSHSATLKAAMTKANKITVKKGKLK